MRTEKRTRLDRAPASCNHAVNKQHDNGADHGTNQPRTFAGPIPAERLPQVRCNERTNDSEYGGENEAGRLVAPGKVGVGTCFDCSRLQ